MEIYFNNIREFLIYNEFTTEDNIDFRSNFRSKCGKYDVRAALNGIKIIDTHLKRVTASVAYGCDFVTILEAIVGKLRPLPKPTTIRTSFERVYDYIRSILKLT